MCNIAGYIGKKQAAPILIEMMRREEGYAGGYYTGLTVHDGTRLFTEKCVGPLDTLLAETAAATLRGTCGFIHSRSRSGGDREWGQPFLTADGRTSMIANGSAGVFLTEEMQAKRCAEAASLERDGYAFASRTHGAVGNYPKLSDGTSIHSTDLMCQYVARLIDRGMAPDAAMSELLSVLPCEAVFLLMREECPDDIFISRINYPMTIGIAEDGDVYFATTRLAFPEDVTFTEITFLPPMQTYRVTRGGYAVSEHPIHLNACVAEITEERIETAYPLFLECLRKATKPLQGWEIIPSYASVWPQDEINQQEPMLYFMIERLGGEGRLGIKELILPGAVDGYQGKKFGVYIKE